MYLFMFKTLYATVKYLSGNNNQLKQNKVLSRTGDYFKIPITIIITHLTMLMAENIIQEGYFVRFFTLEVNNNFDYLYKIKPGLVKSGYGIKAA